MLNEYITVTEHQRYHFLPAHLKGNFLLFIRIYSLTFFVARPARNILTIKCCWVLKKNTIPKYLENILVGLHMRLTEEIISDG